MRDTTESGTREADDKLQNTRRVGFDQIQDTGYRSPEARYIYGEIATNEGAGR
jgi:hypothetical protein